MEESEFIRKYGAIEVEFIDPPRQTSPWFVYPHALNYFYKGKLYRTRHERGSGTFELFLDLMYVGIVANIASHATEDASFQKIGLYFMVFVPAWQIWADLKDFMNFFYNNDLPQRVYVLLITLCLVAFGNNAPFYFESQTAASFAIIFYVTARILTAAMLFFYTIFVREIREQLRIYSLSVFGMSLFWFLILLIPDLKPKIIFSAILLSCEQILFIVMFHPWFKRLLKAEFTSAVNIEHEIERMSAFFIIALGEFTYVAVAGSPAGLGPTVQLLRAVCGVIISYCLIWLYTNGSGSTKAVHAIRRSPHTAYLWIYSHLGLVAALVLAADASGELLIGEDNLPLRVMFAGGLALALVLIYVIAFCDKALDDDEDKFILRKKFRLAPRLVSAALLVVFIFLPSIGPTLLLLLTTAVVFCLLIFETFFCVPRFDGISLCDIPEHLN